MIGTIVGFALAGLGGRFGQLAIQKRPLLSNPAGHVIAAALFGYIGYWECKWEERAGELLALRLEQMGARRKIQKEREEATQ